LHLELRFGFVCGEGVEKMQEASEHECMHFELQYALAMKMQVAGVNS